MPVISQVKSIFPASCWPNLWLVGGTVRDLLLRQPVQDIDLVAALSPKQLSSCGFRPVDPVSNAPIWFRHIPALGKVEITRLAVADQLADDLVRRDFTVNALAMTLNSEVVDLLNGQDDLEQRSLRVCSSQSFHDDPIRIFRALRFAADGWHILPETAQRISEAGWEERFATIPVERFSCELIKALEKPDPACFFTSMISMQVGRAYLPELFRMPDVPAGPLQYHPEGDLLTHALQVLQRVAAGTDDPLARFCGLFHDLGKLSTDPALYPKHHGHDEAGFEPARQLCTRLRLPAAWQKALAWTCRLHTKANNWDELRSSTQIRLALNATKTGIAKILPLVSAADKPDGSNMKGWATALQVAAMTTAELGIGLDRLQQMAVEQRSGYLLQRRAERLKSCLLLSER